MKTYSENLIKTLVVEDDPVSSNLLLYILSRSSPYQISPEDAFEITTVKSLELAFNVLDNNEFDVILLDLDLPDSSGIDTVIRTHEKYPKAAIVVITGAYDEGVGVKTVASGAQDYLIKGKYDTAMLIKSIKYAIERKKKNHEKIRSKSKPQSKPKPRSK